MRLTLIGLLLILTVGCRNTSSDQTDSKSSTSQPPETTTLPAADTLCFQQVMNRDTTTLQLVVNGKQATGYVDIKPFEKDRARGSFAGIVEGKHIQADWQRAGEGVTQPYTLDLTFKGDAIIWYEGERIEKEGKWVLKQPNTGYQYVLTKTDCLPNPSR